MKESSVQPPSRHFVFSDQAVNRVREAALAFAEKGLAVLPLHSIQLDQICTCGSNPCSSAGKHPLTPHGVKNASRDLAIIGEWWQRYPFANVGIATGSISNVVVLDVDVKHGGFESLQKLESENGLLENHTQAHSGGGGRHYYFLAPKEPLKNRTNLAPGIDFRGEGGYIVAPPSTHTSGKTYQWANELPLQLPPNWLVSLVQNGKGVGQTESTSTINRNDTLVSIGGFIKCKGISGASLQDILPLINQHAFSTPLSADEVAWIVKSLSNYEDWPVLTPLVSHQGVASPLLEKHIPVSLREWVCDVCERMQLPLEFIAAPAIVAISSLIGRKIQVRPLKHDDWTVVPNLFGLMVGDSGVKKSAALNQALKPLSILEKRARATFEKDCQDFAKREKDLAVEIECLKQGMATDRSL